MAKYVKPVQPRPKGARNKVSQGARDKRAGIVNRMGVRYNSRTGLAVGAKASKPAGSSASKPAATKLTDYAGKSGEFFKDFLTGGVLKKR